SSNSWLLPSSRARGGAVARGHVLIGAAAADVADVGVDGACARLRLLLEQRPHRHDHAALAIAALRHVVLEPSLLYLVSVPFWASPSIVVICFPSASLTGTHHERIATPSMCTVQAPHWAMPQPYLVPVSPIVSRNTHSSGVLGSTSSW